MRTTCEPKECIIRVRVPEDMRNYIQNVSNKAGISVSEYLREIIKKEKSNDRKRISEIGNADK
jgi:predicted DNA binding CopG/RHH family protein